MSRNLENPVLRRTSLVLVTLMMGRMGFPGVVTLADGGSDARSDDLADVEELSVEPERILLRGANRQQQLLITGKTPDGRLRDCTRDCELTIDSPGVARLRETRVAAIADGETSLRVKLGGLEVVVPVLVDGFGGYRPVHFENDVLPVLSKLGCNGGGCHGKPSGQNGFKLSVFAFDPASDFEALVKEGRGRRVSLDSPARSLFLLKPTAVVPHGGGSRLDIDSMDYEVLYEWIRQGALLGGEDSARLAALEVTPETRVMGFRTQQQILTTAIFSNGQRRDVTRAASYVSNSERVAEVDEFGLVETGQVPGEAAITINYMGRVAVVRTQVPQPNGPDHYPELPVENEIDAFVWSKLETMGIVPSGLADDATFARRLYLDAIGTLPRPEEVRAFLSDRRGDKRRLLVDRLLEREEYSKFWALKWADVLLVDSEKLGGRGAFEFYRWLRAQFARNRPYDEWARELITATGDSGKSGPVNFYRAARTPEEAARYVSQAFLGVRLECAQCHHHPFEKWSREDFYSLTGFFNGLERKVIRGERELIYHAGYREARMPLSGEPVPVRPLDGSTPAGIERRDPRVPLAEWMTSPDNPWFARLAVNRLWKHFHGRGLIEPEDDFRSTNPPTNPELLDFLAQRFVESGYDIKGLTRLILNSRVYQISSLPNELNEDDEQNFSHYYVKRLPAEVLLDAISEVTGVPEEFPGRPHGTRALDLWDNRLPSYFLDIFGRPERESPCECGRSSDPTMAQALHLMNAPEIQRKITSKGGRVAELIRSEADQEEIVEELCLAALGRFPGDKEIEAGRELFANAPPREAAEDFLWALLNSYQFLFIH